MTIPETETYESGIYQIELTDPVIGGADGIANLQAKQLANRTNWLKVALAKVIDGTTSIAKALKLATARKISLGGVLSGSASFDGSADITIQASFADGTLTINSIQGLATALGNDAYFATTVSDALLLKAPLASPALTGSPTAPTQAKTDNSTKIATTAFIKALLATASETAQGLIEIATNAEVQTGTDTTRAITPAGMMSAFNKVHGTSGYQKLPNGLIIQWGYIDTTSSTGTTSFPISFPNACVVADLQIDGASAQYYATICTSRNVSNFSWWVANTNVNFTWFAIGY